VFLRFLLVLRERSGGQVVGFLCFLNKRVVKVRIQLESVLTWEGNGLSLVFRKMGLTGEKGARKDSSSVKRRVNMTDMEKDERALNTTWKKKRGLSGERV